MLIVHDWEAGIGRGEGGRSRGEGGRGRRERLHSSTILFNPSYLPPSLAHQLMLYSMYALCRMSTSSWLLCVDTRTPAHIRVSEQEPPEHVC